MTSPAIGVRVRAGKWRKPQGYSRELPTMKRLFSILRQLRDDARGSVFVEYLLLLTLIGIGVIAGLAAVRTALLNELADLANAINAIN